MRTAQTGSNFIRAKNGDRSLVVTRLKQGRDYMDKIRIGVIGVGRIGKIHVDNLRKLQQAEVVAISDLYANAELVEWAQERDIPIVTADSNAIIHHPDIDAIFICSSTDSHVPLIESAARSGKHIFARSRSAWISGRRRKRWRKCAAPA